jgi:hypothetical protein
MQAVEKHLQYSSGQQTCNINMANQQRLQSLVDIFNKKSRSDLLLTKKCSDLKEGKHYYVYSLKKMDTSVGDAILAKLSDTPLANDGEPKFQVFLPKRFVHQLQNEELELIQPGSLYLISNGQSGNGSVELSLNITESHCT